MPHIMQYIHSLSNQSVNVKQRMMFCRSGASRECHLQSFIIRGGHQSMPVRAGLLTTIPVSWSLPATLCHLIRPVIASNQVTYSSAPLTAMVSRPPSIMKHSGRCGFQQHSKRQDAASTEVFHVKHRQDCAESDQCHVNLMYAQRTCQQAQRTAR